MSIVITINGSFSANSLLQLSFLSDLRELRSALIVKCVFSSFLGYTAIMLNIMTMYHMQKASSLQKNLTTLKPSPTISDVGVGLFAQSFNAFWTSGLNWRTLAATLTKCLIFLVIHFFFLFFFFFFNARLVLVPWCCGCYFRSFLGIHLHLRDQDLVTGKRVVIVVISIYGCKERHLLFAILRCYCSLKHHREFLQKSPNS